MLDTIFSNTDGSLASIPGLLIAIVTAAAVGLLISLTYIRTHRAPRHAASARVKLPSRSFAVTLVALPAVITVIILLVGNNIARAFSLAGAFSIIRFRSAPGDPKDITYVLLSMAVGLAAGMGFIAYAFIAGVLLCGILLLLEAVRFGSVRGAPKTLKITVPENLDYQNAFDGVLERFTLSSSLRKVRTTDLGSLFELNYAVVTKSGVSEKEFIDELRRRNGNLPITLVLDADENDF
ncbi:MAG: DUF4956 domain-containing protein [Oscillospiraceae bacterium]|jgi:hypothetical protein|nr:DUF4956 domain-containing protein [Oscillospiraceae bacterium]